MLSLLEAKRNGGQSPPYRLWGSLAVLLFVAGCGQRDEIASYRVRKPELVDPSLVSAANAPAGPVSEQQTLGVIVPVAEMGWFFKLTGDKQAVEPQREAFLVFVQSIKFSPSPESKPSWKLPAGWRE